MSSPSPSAPTFDEYTDPEAILNVETTPPPRYKDIIQSSDKEEETFVPNDVEKARPGKRGCRSKSMIALKVFLILMLVTTFVLVAFTTARLVSMNGFTYYMERDISQLQNGRLDMLSDISRIEGEVAKISETVYSHHTTTTTTMRPLRRYRYSSHDYYGW